jgi:hypothetical protein
MKNESFGKKTVGLPLTKREELAFDAMIKRTGKVKQVYVRNLVIADLEKEGWLPQNQEEKTGEAAATED